MAEQPDSISGVRTSAVPPWQEDREGVELSFGTWLKKQREARSIDLAEVSEHTKISSRFLRALEEDESDILPAQVFVRGFLRQYAKFVGLDEDNVVTYYVGQWESQAENESRASQSHSEGNWKWLLAVILGAVVLGGAGYWTYRQASQKASAESSSIASSSRDTTTRPPSVDQQSELASDELVAQQDTDSESEPSATVLAQDTANLPSVRVTIDFVEDCWVESTVDGVRQISTIYAKGESLRLEADDKVWLRLGNFAGSVVSINDRVYSWPNPDSRSKTRELEVDADFIATVFGLSEVVDDGAAGG